MSDKPSLAVLKFPDRNIQDIPLMLRNLAETIEQGKYGDVHSVAWVAILDDDVACGLIGTEGFSAADAVFILSRGIKALLP